MTSPRMHLNGSSWRIFCVMLRWWVMAQSREQTIGLRAAMWRLAGSRPGRGRMEERCDGARNGKRCLVATGVDITAQAPSMSGRPF